MLNYCIGRLKNLANALDPEALVEKVFDQDEIKDKMVTLNQHQMFDEGVDSKGDSLGDYSTVSVEKYGKRPGRIQLYQTGEFYNSMEAVTNKDEAFVEGDMQKPDKDLSVMYPHALGLDNESVSEIRKMAKVIINEEVRSAFAR